MGETAVVGQDKLLALDVDVIDVVAVNDKPPADADEQVGIPAQLSVDHILDLPQLECEHTGLVVGLHEVAVIAVRRDEHDAVGVNAHQVGGGGYDQVFLEHEAAKVAT